MEKPFSLRHKQSPSAAKENDRRSSLASKDTHRRRSAFASKDKDRKGPLASKDTNRKSSLASKDADRSIQKQKTDLKQSKKRDPRLIIMTDRERDDTYTEALLQRSNSARIQSTNLTASTLTERSKRSCTTSLAPSKRTKRRRPNYILAMRTDTSPISNLNVDCLFQIFGYCGDIETLCILASVCRRWREIALDLFLWRKMREEWEPFLDMLCWIDRNPNHLARRQLLHTRTIRMFGSAGTNTYTTTTPLRINAHLLTNVTQLVMTKMCFQDVIELIAHTPSLEVLRCDKIRTRGTSDKMMLGYFSGMQRLRVLDLRFREPCEYTDYAFTLSRRRIRKVLPSSLQELRLSNVYDPEEVSLLLPRDRQQRNNSGSSSSSTSSQHQQEEEATTTTTTSLPVQQEHEREEEGGPTATVLYRRQWMEDTLVDKYQFLHPLTNLRTLRLGRCNAYTARVWRACIKPCVANLEHLTLVGWYNNNTEALLSASSLATTKTKMDMDQDTQLAIQETILEMQHKMKRLVLLDFVCGQGVVGGIKKLKYASLKASYQPQQDIIGGATAAAAADDGGGGSVFNHGPSESSSSSSPSSRLLLLPSSTTSNADDLLNQHVSFCKIDF